MIEANIEALLKARIATNTTGLSVAWPNKYHDGQAPFLQVDFVRVGRTDPTIAGGKTLSQWRIVATVVHEALTDQNTRPATEKAEVVASLFPFPLRIAVGGGHIQITKPPDIQEGYRQDNQWRVPVTIDLLASYSTAPAGA